MSLFFGTSTSDVFRVTDNATIRLTEASELTWMIEFYIVTFTDGRRVAAKNANDGTGGPQFLLSGTNEVQFNFGLTVQNSTAFTLGASLVTGKWYTAGLQYNPADTQTRIYLGSTTTTLGEASYGTTFSPSGVSTSTADLCLANQSAASPVFAFQGNIGAFAQFNRLLNLGEMRQWQFARRTMAGCKALYHLGYHGTGTHPDYSGTGNNSASISGASVGGNSPYMAPFGKTHYRPIQTTGGAPDASMTGAIVMA